MQMLPSDMMTPTTNQPEKSTHFQNVTHTTAVWDNNPATRDLIMLITLAVLIIIINSLIALSFIIVKKLRHRPANIMICSQACTDLFTGLVYIPCYLIRNEAALTLCMFLSCYMLYLSLFNLLMISIDRYLALCRPFLHRRYIDVPRTTNMVSLVWTVPLLFVLIPLAWWFGDAVIKTKATNGYICTMWILMLILVVSMTILYVLATKQAKETIRTRRSSLGSRAQGKAASLARKELRVVHLFGLLLVFFVAAYLPILYINFCFIIGLGNLVPPVLEVISLYLLIINSVLNPILCIKLKKDYLRAIKTLLLFNFTASADTPVTSQQRYAAVECSDGSFAVRNSVSQPDADEDDKLIMGTVSYMMEKEACTESYPKFMFI